MNFNYARFFGVVLVCISGILPIVYSNSKSENPQRFLGIYKIPKETPQPINIDTMKTKKLNLPPLTLIGGVRDKVKVINTGKSVEVVLQEPNSASRIYGGVLLNDTYKYEKNRIYWASNALGDAGSTINNQGTPLEVVAIFFNEKYGSFDNAINYRDGIAQLYFCLKVLVGKPNPLFPPFANVLRKIRTAGSSQYFTLGETFQWFTTAIAAPTVAYYAYPGSYTDEQTGKVYYCSTTIIYPPALVVAVSISVEQFNSTLLSLKDVKGDPLSNAVKQYPRKVPVVQARGFYQYLVPK